MHHALSDVVSLHPPLNLVKFNFLASHAELEIVLVCLDDISLLVVSDDGLHLVWFDVLVELPLGQTRPVLAYPGKTVSLDIMKRWEDRLPNVLSSETELLFYQDLDFWERSLLDKMQLYDPVFIWLPVTLAESRRFLLSWSGIRDRI